MSETRQDIEQAIIGAMYFPAKQQRWWLEN